MLRGLENIFLDCDKVWNIAVETARVDWQVSIMLRLANDSDRNEQSRRDRYRRDMDVYSQGASQSIIIQVRDLM